MFMPDAAAAPVAAVQPDPPRAVPDHVGRVLGLIHTFVTYGKKLANTLRQHADDPQGLSGFAFIATRVRTGDLTLILDRIARGLLRAAALEDRLSQLAARGRDLTPSFIRMPLSEKIPAAEAAVAPIDNRSDDPAPQADSAPLPTHEDILAKDRRRPVGAVLVDICHDLGIMPGDMDRTTWDELLHYVIGYSGSLLTLLFKRPAPLGPENPDVFQGYFTGPIPTAIAFAPWPAHPSLVPAGTGPP